MARFPFLRKPVKPILYSLLTLLLLSAALIFCLQSVLDALAMEHFVSSYAYIGTVYSRTQSDPLLVPLPAAVTDALRDSELVASVDARQTFSAKAMGMCRSPDTFAVMETIDQHYFIEGVVLEPPEMIDGRGRTEHAKVEVARMYAGVRDGTNTLNLRIIHDPQTVHPLLKKGDHIFFVGRYSYSGDAVVPADTYLYTPEILPAYGLTDLSESPLTKYALLVLPEGLTAAESEAYIQNYMEQTGLARLCKMELDHRDAFTVRAVSEMSLLLTVADGTTFLTAGRELNRTDIGRKNCVIPQAMADRNGLAVGDAVFLALSDGCYVSRAPIDVVSGWESGYPCETDGTLLFYGQAEDYTVVGIYACTERRLTGDALHFSKNDIFLPAFGTENDDVRPYAFSFRVLGPDYERFMDAFEVPMHEAGYSIRTVDSGWEDVQESYYAMEARRALMLGSAFFAFLAAVALLDALLLRHFRHEYGLCRLPVCRRARGRGRCFDCIFDLCTAASGTHGGGGSRGDAGRRAGGRPSVTLHVCGADCCLPAADAACAAQ